MKLAQQRSSLDPAPTVYGREKKNDTLPFLPPRSPGAYDHEGKEVQRRKLQDQANVASHKKGWGGAPRFYSERVHKAPGPGDYKTPSAIGGSNPEGRM